jgi:hypothetical protein
VRPDDAAGLLSSAIRVFPQIDFPWPGIAYHVRARFVTGSPFFPRSRWVTPEAHTSGDFDVRTSGSTVGVPPRAPRSRPWASPVSRPTRRAGERRRGSTSPSRVRAAVVLDVFDVRGARVARLVDGERPAGPLESGWDGRDDAGGSDAGGTLLRGPGGGRKELADPAHPPAVTTLCVSSFVDRGRRRADTRY